MVKLALLSSIIAAFVAVSFGQDPTYANVLTNAFQLFKNGPPSETDLGNVAKLLSNFNHKTILQTVFDMFLQNGDSTTAGVGNGDASNKIPDITEIIGWISKLSKYRYVLDSFLGSGNLTTMSNRITEMLSNNIPGLQQSQEVQEIVINLLQLYEKFRNSPMTEKCLMDGLILFNGISKFDIWAMKMVDSMGKIPVGILDGNLKSLGAFDQCRSIKSLEDSEQKNTSPINGKYCTIDIPLTSLVGSFTDAAGAGGGAFGAAFANFVLGLCIPDSCSEAELIYIVNEVLANTTIQNTTIKASGPNCQAESVEYSSEAIAAFCLSGLIILLMVIGTAYDIIYIQIPKQTEKPQQNGYTNSDKYKTEHCNDKEKGIDYVKQPECKIRKPGLAGKLILSFSVYTNGKKLLNTNQSPGAITAINGIRFISMTWVILGHAYSTVLYNGQNLASYAKDLMNRWTFNAIENALISVDTFFTLSGLLMSYLILKEMKKKKGARGINWGLFYFHRFWRLTPPYMIIMFVYFATFPYWSDGPFWSTKYETGSCEKYWWRNLLYINNLFPIQDMCFGHAWYLANDMQFYIISPILFIPLFYNEIIGVLVCLLALAGTTVAAGLVSYNNNLPPSSFGGAEGSNQGDYFDTYYDKPWCRMGPYIVGILAGYILYKTNCKIRIHKLLNLSLWLICTVLGCVILYGLFEPLRGNNLLSIEVSALYNATHRSVWGFCVSWVIVACATGHGGFVNTLLSWKAFVVLSRLTYIAYLVHPVFMALTYSGYKDTVLLSDSYVIDVFLAWLTKSFGVAFILSLACEAPMMALEKVLLAPVTKPKRNAGNQNGTLTKDSMGEKEKEVHKIP